MSQLKIELLPVWCCSERVVSRGGLQKLFRILGVYSGFFAFIGSELADYTIFRLISRRFDEKRLLLFTDYILAVILQM